MSTNTNEASPAAITHNQSPHTTNSLSNSSSNASSLKHHVSSHSQLNEKKLYEARMTSYFSPTSGSLPLSQYTSSTKSDSARAKDMKDYLDSLDGIIFKE
ncbi:uncharacterized protein LY89DRAFT_686171 [Mollisia scopiformis]|uniref:Uncharacterized protein n=1 Tax=Mollisia scopiformis TaxID=149040 RepID=A0A194X5E8_MOLSC|nr:uncharacterized protein LY89DRAFT_686171 [Mollisia scopiformis]KUJ15408.1 hypothetical protein LY89DRAFT_686171 [Mollisia scopiformis]